MLLFILNYFPSHFLVQIQRLPPRKQKPITSKHYCAFHGSPRNWSSKVIAWSIYDYTYSRRKGCNNGEPQTRTLRIAIQLYFAFIQHIQQKTFSCIKSYQMFQVVQLSSRKSQVPRSRYSLSQKLFFMQRLDTKNRKTYTL